MGNIKNWTGQEIDELHDPESGVTWDEVSKITGLTRSQARSRVRTYKQKQKILEKIGEIPEQDPMGDSLLGVSFIEGFNEAEAESKTARIKTLPQLLEACEVDLDTWYVDHWIANKWEVGAKDASKQVKIHPLFQVKAWLKRIVPKTIFPVIQPIKCTRPKRLPINSKTSGIARSLVFADPHFGFFRDLQSGQLDPFHSRAALDIILQIARTAKPDRIDLLGDMMDLSEWTDKFIKEPEFYWTTQPALIEASWWLQQFRLLAELTLYQGNHDKRLETTIKKHLTAAYKLKAVDELDLPPALSIQRLLALHTMDIRWIGDYPAGGDWLNDEVCLSHGDIARNVPGNTARAVSEHSAYTEIFGHIHRIEWVSRTRRNRNNKIQSVGFCPGCTCRLDSTVPGHKPRQQWQNGCAVVDYEIDGGAFSISPVLINNNQALWNGQLFTARDRLDELKEQHPDWLW